MDTQFKSYFITFWGGLQNYIDRYGQFVNFQEACARLTQQAKSLDLFEHILTYSDQDLINDPEFWGQHSNFVTTHPQGWGYWLWKPYIIRKTLALMSEGDILVYCDAGCELDIRNRQMIRCEVIEQTRQDLIMASLVGPEWGPECCWCKRDLWEYMGLTESHQALASQQHQATAICLKKCSAVQQLVEDWYRIACHDNYHLLDDSPSVLENISRFREHRHDQSIFSLLTKRAGIFSSKLVSSSNFTGAIYLSRTKNGVSRIIT